MLRPFLLLEAERGAAGVLSAGVGVGQPGQRRSDLAGLRLRRPLVDDARALVPGRAGGAVERQHGGHGVRLGRHELAQVLLGHARRVGDLRRRRRRRCGGRRIG